MSAALAGLAALIVVVYALAVSTTISTPIDTYLNVIVNFIGGRRRILTVDEAATLLTYCTLIYLIVFSAAFFILRMLALFLAAFGVPDEQQIRRTQELRRGRGPQIELARRTARLTALYLFRAQRAADRRTASMTTPDASGKAPAPTLKDFK
jgi:hypothetical protein